MARISIALAIIALLTLGTVATAPAQMVPHQRADGLWVCPNDETRIIVNGDWRVVCFTGVPSISMQEFNTLREQDRQRRVRQDAEEASMAERRLKERADERATILKTCADPAINQAWCANEIARLRP
jgi:hypothetical protein